MKIKKLVLSFLLLMLMLSLSSLILKPISASSSQSPSILDSSSQSPPKLERLVFDSENPYLYLGTIANADVSEDGIVVSTFENRIIILDIGTLKATKEYSTLQTPTSVFYYLDVVFSIQGDEIILNSVSSTRKLSGHYSSFKIETESNYLVCIDTSDNILILDLLQILASPSSQIDVADFLLYQFDLSTELKTPLSDFTVDSQFIYLAIENQTNRFFDDIFRLDIEGSHKLEKMYERTNKVTTLLKTSDQLFILSKGDVYSYEIFDGKLSLINNKFFGAASLSLFSSRLYMLTEENSMISTELSLGDLTDVFQSQSKASGFFSFPSSAYTRRGNLFITDTLNDRLFISGYGKIKAIDGFERTNSVVSDNLGNIYVAYGINKIAKLDSSLKTIDNIVLSRSIKKLLIDTNNNIFVLSGSQAFHLDGTNQLIPLSHLNSAENAAIGIGSTALYIYDGTSLYKNSSPLDPLQPSDSLFSHSGVVSFSVDLDGNVFFFDSQGRLFCYKSDIESVEEIILESDGIDLSFATDICISTIENDQITYGDLVFVDSVRHSIYKLSKDSTIVSITDSSHVSPSITPEIAISSTKPIVFRVKTAAEVFPRPIEIGSTYTIQASERIIYCEEYNSIEEYAFVIYEDEMTKNLISGYVFRSMIDFTSYSYSSPPNASAVVFFNYTPVYKFPSVHAAKLVYFDKGQSLELIDFAAPMRKTANYSTGVYIDNYGRSWYRVKLGEDTTGFIQADNLSLNQYVPQSRPKPNATIKAHEGVMYASLYAFNEETGTYTLIADDLPLPEGTRIELVKTPLDAQSEYTQIKFYREELGTLTCYVKTVHIEYDSINTLQIVAISALVVVLLSVVLLIIYKIRHKRKIIV